MTTPFLHTSSEDRNPNAASCEVISHKRSGVLQSNTYTVLDSDAHKAIAVCVYNGRKVYPSVSRAVTTSMNPDKYWERTSNVVGRIDVKE